MPLLLVLLIVNLLLVAVIAHHLSYRAVSQWRGRKERARVERRIHALRDVCATAEPRASVG